MAKTPEIEKLTAAKDEKKLIKALGFKSDPSVRAAAADALSLVGEAGALKPLVAIMESTEEESDVRKAAVFALGKIASRLIGIQNSTDTGSLSKSDLKKFNKDAEAIDDTRKALKKQMSDGTPDITLEASRAFMSLPITGSSVFDGAFSSSAFAFAPPEQSREQSDTQREPLPEPAAADEHEDQPDVETSTPSQEEEQTGTEQLPEPEPTSEEEPSGEQSDTQKKPQPEPVAAAEHEDQPDVGTSTPAQEEDEAEAVKQSEAEVTAEDESAPAEEAGGTDDDLPTQELPEQVIEKRQAEPPEVRSDEIDLQEPVEIAQDTYWVGTRTNSMLEMNIYLRIFRNGDKTLNLLIDPGPPDGLTKLVEKLTKLIGGVRNLNIMFLNHQDPDVCYNAGHIQKLNPGCAILCSQASWRLVKHYGLDEKMFKPTESFKDGIATLSTGHTVQFVPTPFCHFRGATMLYDRETGVLFSGDFLGGLSPSNDLFAREGAWEGISTFHSIYMPSKEALKHAVNNIRNLPEMPVTVAPQHGCILRGEQVDEYLDRVEKLEVGLDLFLKEGTKQNCISALNELIRSFAEVMDNQVVAEAMKAFHSDGSFPDTIVGGENGVTDIKADPYQSFELFLREIREKTPAEKLDLVDVRIVKVLTVWKIPLPDFYKAISTNPEAMFT